MGSVLSVEKLTRRFGSNLAIDRLSFTLSAGEIVGFLGPNGAGKTTTLRILSGLIDATSGFAAIGGVPIAGRRRKICRLFAHMAENNPLPEMLTPFEYLQLQAHLKEVDDVRRDVIRVLRACDLLCHAKRQRIGQLSRGYRQRVGLAGALLGRPIILFLDEPTAGLDPHQVRDIRRVLRELPDSPAILFSSHILSEVEAFCPRILILNRGRLIADGTIADLRREFLGFQESSQRPSSCDGEERNGAMSPLESIFLAATERLR